MTQNLRELPGLPASGEGSASSILIPQTVAETLARLSPGPHALWVTTCLVTRVAAPHDSVLGSFLTSTAS